MSGPLTAPAAETDGSLTSASLGPPAVLALYRLAAFLTTLALACTTLPRVRDHPALADAYHYTDGGGAGAAAFYSSWCFYATVAYFGCALVASVHRVRDGVRAKRRGGTAATTTTTTTHAADASAAASTAAALLHAALPGSAFTWYATWWVVVPAAAAVSQEAAWEVLRTLLTPLGLAASGGGLAALLLDVCLSRLLAPRPRWLLLTTAWPAVFLAAGAVAGARRGTAAEEGGAGGAAGAPPPPPLPPDTAWASAAAYSLGATILAHLVATLALGGLVWVREGCCVAGAAVWRRAKRA